MEFTPGSASGSLTLTFDGADGYAWRASAIVFGNGGPSVVPIALDGGSAGSVVISGFGKQATRVLLAATIADRAGVQVAIQLRRQRGHRLAGREVARPARRRWTNGPRPLGRGPFFRVLARRLPEGHCSGTIGHRVTRPRPDAEKSLSV